MNARKGIAAVEFAIVAPIVFLLIFGGIEAASVIQLRSSIQNAARECARHSITPNATTESCQTLAASSFQVSRLRGASVSLSPNPTNAKAGTLISVTAVAPYGSNSWGTGFIFRSSYEIRASVAMRKE